jgi:hypothetical protein
MAQKLVPVTEGDKKKSYYKYYLEDMVDAPPEHYQKVLAGPMDPSKALPVQERNRLFEPGYFEEEIGYCVMPDGTGYISNLVKMPGVSGEMFDWWFAWHGLDNLRYTIWNREDHLAKERFAEDIADMVYKSKMSKQVEIKLWEKIYANAKQKGFMKQKQI